MRDNYNPYRFPELLESNAMVFGPTAEIFGTQVTPRIRPQGPPRPEMFSARNEFDSLEFEAEQLIRRTVVGFALLFMILVAWVEHGSEPVYAAQNENHIESD